MAPSAKKIFFIGVGNMGGAILCALTENGYPSSSVLFYETRNERADEIMMKSKAIRTTSLAGGFSEADIVFLCLKPHVFLQFRNHLLAESKNSNKKPIIVSIMAGIKTRDLRPAFAEKTTVIRAMPNIAVTTKKGTVALAIDGVEDSALQTIEFLFSTCANTVRIYENQMDAVTGLSGSGPAFVFQFVEALVMGGVKMGLQRDVAMKLALSTVQGSVCMLESSGLSPGELTANVCSPAGTTITGLQELENRAFRGVVMAAVEAATKRSMELGKS